jgi:hypothetical protein
MYIIYLFAVKKMQKLHIFLLLKIIIPLNLKEQINILNIKTSMAGLFSLNQ